MKVKDGNNTIRRTSSIRKSAVLISSHGVLSIEETPKLTIDSNIFKTTNNKSDAIHAFLFLRNNAYIYGRLKQQSDYN